MEPFRYQLVFDSAFVPAGADAAENAIRRVGDEASRATRTAGNNDQALQRVMSDNAAKARVSEFAYYDLDKAIRRTDSSGQKFTAGTAQISKGSSNASRSLLALSQGFEDAQYGIRGVLNNIPGLVMALGGTAGLAGAISIAAVAGSLLFEWLGKTEEKAEDTAEKLKELGEKAEQIKADKIALMTQGLWDAWDAADATRQAYDETKKASDSYSTAALSNAEKIRNAEQLIADILGIQVDRFKELEAQAQMVAQKRELATQQAIRNQQEEIEKSQNAVRIAQEKLETARIDQATNKQNLDDERAKLLVLDQQYQVLKKQSEEKKGWAGALGDGGWITDQTVDAAKAETKMNAPGYMSALESTRARVKALEDAVGKPDAELNRTVIKMENQVKSAETVATDKIAAATIKIQELQSTLDADTTLADAQLAVDQGVAMADGLKDLIGKITAGNAEQQAAKDAIEKAAISGGKITADELPGLAKNLTALMGGIQSGLSTTTENIAQLMNQMRTYQSDQAILDREIKDLKNKYETIKRR